MRLSRRRMLETVGSACAGALAGALAVVAQPAQAQVSDWSTADERRFAAFRGAFSEYDDIPDRDFARRMEALFRSLDGNPDAAVVAAEISRRLPEYRDVPRARIQREMVSLFRKAVQHFELYAPGRP